MRWGGGSKHANIHREKMHRTIVAESQRPTMVQITMCSMKMSSVRDLCVVPGPSGVSDMVTVDVSGLNIVQILVAIATATSSQRASQVTDLLFVGESVCQDPYLGPNAMVRGNLSIEGYLALPRDNQWRQSLETALGDCNVHLEYAAMSCFTVWAVTHNGALNKIKSIGCLCTDDDHVVMMNTVEDFLGALQLWSGVEVRSVRIHHMDLAPYLFHAEDVSFFDYVGGLNVVIAVDLDTDSAITYELAFKCKFPSSVKRLFAIDCLRDSVYQLSMMVSSYDDPSTMAIACGTFDE